MEQNSNISCIANGPGRWIASWETNYSNGDCSWILSDNPHIILQNPGIIPLEANCVFEKIDGKCFLVLYGAWHSCVENDFIPDISDFNYSCFEKYPCGDYGNNPMSSISSISSAVPIDSTSSISYSSTSFSSSSTSSNTSSDSSLSSMSSSDTSSTSINGLDKRASVYFGNERDDESEISSASSNFCKDPCCAGLGTAGRWVRKWVTSCSAPTNPYGMMDCIWVTESVYCASFPDDPGSHIGYCTYENHEEYGCIIFEYGPWHSCRDGDCIPTSPDFDSYSLQCMIDYLDCQAEKCCPCAGECITLGGAGRWFAQLHVQCPGEGEECYWEDILHTTVLQNWGAVDFLGGAWDPNPYCTFIKQYGGFCFIYVFGYWHPCNYGDDHGYPWYMKCIPNLPDWGGAVYDACQTAHPCDNTSDDCCRYSSSSSSSTTSSSSSTSSESSSSSSPSSISTSSKSPGMVSGTSNSSSSYSFKCARCRARYDFDGICSGGHVISENWIKTDIIWLDCSFVPPTDCNIIPIESSSSRSSNSSSQLESSEFLSSENCVFNNQNVISIVSSKNEAVSWETPLTTTVKSPLVILNDSEYLTSIYNSRNNTISLFVKCYGEYRSESSNSIVSLESFSSPSTSSSTPSSLSSSFFKSSQSSESSTGGCYIFGHLVKFPIAQGDWTHIGRNDPCFCYQYSIHKDGWVWVPDTFTVDKQWCGGYMYSPEWDTGGMSKAQIQEHCEEMVFIDPPSPTFIRPDWKERCLDCPAPATSTSSSSMSVSSSSDSTSTSSSVVAKDGAGVSAFYCEKNRADWVFYRDERTGKLTVRRGSLHFKESPVKGEVAIGDVVEQTPAGEPPFTKITLDENYGRLKGILMSLASAAAGHNGVMLAINKSTNIYGFFNKQCTGSSCCADMDLQLFRIDQITPNKNNYIFELGGKTVYVSPAYIYKSGNNNSNVDFFEVSVETKGTVATVSSSSESFKEAATVVYIVDMETEQVKVYYVSENQVISVDKLSKTYPEVGGVAILPVLPSWSEEGQCITDKISRIGLFDAFRLVTGEIMLIYNQYLKKRERYYDSSSSNSGSDIPIAPYIGCITIPVNMLLDDVTKNIRGCLDRNGNRVLDLLWRPPHLPTRDWIVPWKDFDDSYSYDSEEVNDDFVRVLGRGGTESQCEYNINTLGVGNPFAYVLPSGEYLMFYDYVCYDASENNKFGHFGVGIKMLYSNNTGKTWHQSPYTYRSGARGCIVIDGYMFYILPTGVEMMQTNTIDFVLRDFEFKPWSGLSAEEQTEETNRQNSINLITRKTVYSNAVSQYQKLSGYKASDGTLKVFFYNEKGFLTCCESKNVNTWNVANNF